MNKQASITIRIPSEKRDLVKKVMKDRGHKNYVPIVDAYLDHQESDDKNALDGISYNEEELEIIKEALSHVGMTQANYTKKVLLEACKRTIKQVKKMADLDLNSDEAKKIPNTAFKRIDEWFSHIIKSNVAAHEWWDKVEITAGAIAKKESDGGTGTNRKAINEWLASHEQEIELHHKKMGIEYDHNRRAYNERKRLGIG